MSPYCARWIAVAVVSLAAVAGCSLTPGRKASTAQRTTPSTGIEGLVNVRKSDPGSLTQNHKPGRIIYKQSPPVGGDHNATWQNCAGDVYTEPIANENAVHSLEHGAVWITYRKGLAADQVAALAAKVSGIEYTMLSPYEGLDSEISLQAWGYQLKVAKADDPRIGAFILKYRESASLEPGALCSDGTTGTGSDPKSNG